MSGTNVSTTVRRVRSPLARRTGSSTVAVAGAQGKTAFPCSAKWRAPSVLRSHRGRCGEAVRAGLRAGPGGCCREAEVRPVPARARAVAQDPKPLLLAMGRARGAVRARAKRRSRLAALESLCSRLRRRGSSLSPFAASSRFKASAAGRALDLREIQPLDFRGLDRSAALRAFRVERCHDFLKIDLFA